MELIDLKATRRVALKAGFWRGLASPIMIYSSFHLPAYAAPEVREVANPAASTDGLRGDWGRVGQQLKGALEKEARARGR